jgi:hypothetical protein
MMAIITRKLLLMPGTQFGDLYHEIASNFEILHGGPDLFYSTWANALSSIFHLTRAQFPAKLPVGRVLQRFSSQDPNTAIVL